MDSLENDASTSELTHESVNEQIKTTTQPILRQVERIWAVMGSRNELETSVNKEATGLKSEDTSERAADNR